MSDAGRVSVWVSPFAAKWRRIQEASAASVEWKKGKHGKEFAVVMEIKKQSGNREYWLSHPDETQLRKFYDKVKLDEKGRKKGILMLW